MEQTQEDNYFIEMLTKNTYTMIFKKLITLPSKRLILFNQVIL